MTPTRANAILPVFALSLLLVSSTPAGQNKTERERDGLEGSAQRVRVERESLADRSKPGRVTYSEDCYDQEGNKVLCVQIESSTTLDGGKRRIVLAGGIAAYTYDAQGRIIEIVVSFDGSLFARFIQHYDANGCMVERLGEGGDGSSGRDDLTYDESGNLVKEVEFASSGDPKQSSAVFKWTYSYDRRGLLIHSGYYNLSNVGEECTGKSTNTYDAAGRLVRFDSYEADGTLTLSETYSGYEFDSRRNWIKRTTSTVIRESGRLKPEPDRVEYRTIVYYAP
jgi:hypothetical protein